MNKCSQCYTNEKLRNILKIAISSFYAYDKELIENDTHEQAETHRIAYYLEDNMPECYKLEGYSVDVEYNRHGKYVKTSYRNCLSNLCQNCQDSNNKACLGYIGQSGNDVPIFEECNSCTTDCEHKNNNIETIIKNIRPDILIHKRGKDGIENDLLVIEVKKNENSTKCDKRKLSYLTCENSEYHYQLGVLLVLKKDKAQLTYFENGEISDTDTRS